MMQGAPTFVSLLIVCAAVGEMARKPHVIKRRFGEGVAFFPFLRECREVAR
jgi:hypothetical protein